MAIPRWRPAQKISRQEEWLLKRLTRTRKLFGFLRRHRHELFDDSLQAELEGMYRNTGAGKDPVAPAMLAMASLLQGYVGASDAEAVELSVVDLRWQMVLDVLGSDQPAFSQGALYDFRHRLMGSNMDRRLLERTAELARTTGEFDPKKLPKTLRIAMDSSPLEGAGRVEDTINLLGHAARKVVECVTRVTNISFDEVCLRAGIPVLLASSIKAGLDCDWGDPEQKAGALEKLVGQLDSLQAWLAQELPHQTHQPPLSESLGTLHQILEQDLEPDPDGGGKPRIQKGVARDRRVSIRDAEMRHGRKSKSKRFNGYKRHIAADLDANVIVACAVTPANHPEAEAGDQLHADIERQGYGISELHIDRGYVNASMVDQVLASRGSVLCRPWPVNSNGRVLSKADFAIDLRRLTITCPAGQTEHFRPGTVVEFDPEVCARCWLRSCCTMSPLDHGRTVTLAENERLQHRLRKLVATPSGRQKLRSRVAVEHKLAHIGQRQGRRARYVGRRANLYDLRRAAALQNLETAHRQTTQKAA